jgi:rhodanese-related sulfurtransferase
MQFVIHNWYLFLGIAVTVALLIGPAVLERLYGVKRVAPAQAVRLGNHEAGWFLDVRESAEYDAGHIPQARHIPLSQLKTRLPELEKYKQRPVVVYCRSGQRSGRGALILRRHGFPAVHHLAGGLLAWQNENLPLGRA